MNLTEYIQEIKDNFRISDAKFVTAKADLKKANKILVELEEKKYISDLTIGKAYQSRSEAEDALISAHSESLENIYALPYEEQKRRFSCKGIWYGFEHIPYSVKKLCQI